MKTIKLAAIPALALAAGLSLAACGGPRAPQHAAANQGAGNGGPQSSASAAPAATQPATSPQDAACADWAQLRAAAKQGTSMSVAQIEAAIQQAADAAGPSTPMFQALNGLYTDIQLNNSTGQRMMAVKINAICGTS